MGELMEIIEWFDESGQAMAHRFPPDGSGALKMGAQLIVRESQEAVFFSGGRALDRFAAGRWTLSTANLPLLTSALSLPWGFRSPFRAEVVFTNRKTFTDLRWGTQEPVIFKDEKLGHVRLRAFGNYTLRVDDTLAFVNRVVGTAGHYATSELEGFLRDVIVARLNDFLGETLQTIFDLPANYDEMASAMQARLGPDFARYGLTLEGFWIQSVTPPEEVQRMVDGQGGLALVKDMPAWMQYQMASAIGREQTGGTSDQLVGAGLGVGVGMMLPGMLRDALHVGPSGGAGAPAPTGGGAGGGAAGAGFCAQCGAALPGGARFCPGCGRALDGSQS